ncbi:MAG: type I-E CRISPR-associated protein Cas6/Cse3/CasE [Actinomycetaceae bacterium]|nr:type I-E CRISPR-associated protein Cas6/Cse3/CasE [Actinomycetaceae bacterium]
MADQCMLQYQSVFLTKVPVHTLLSRSALHKPRKGWELNNPQVRHRAIMALFPEVDAKHPRAEMGILFRLDYIPGAPPFFLIQSKEPILQSGLPSEVETKEVLIPKIPIGNPVSFRIAVNAVQRVSSGGIRSIPLDGAEVLPGVPSLLEWLAAKLSPALDNVEIINSRREVLAPNIDKEKRSIQIDTIDGVAIVSDSDALYNLQVAGVGRAKSYGCGLLSVQLLS